MNASDRENEWSADRALQEAFEISGLQNPVAEAYPYRPRKQSPSNLGCRTNRKAFAARTGDYANRLDN